MFWWTAISGEDFHTLTKNGKVYKIPFPAEFCVINHTPQGKQTLKGLKSVSEGRKNFASPRFVFIKCNEPTAFPWGFMGIQATNKFTSQNMLNSVHTKTIENAKLTRKLNETEAEINKKRMSKLGKELGDFKYGEALIVWSDDNSFVRTTVTKTTLNGMPFNEKQIISSTVIDEMVFEYVIFDAKGSVDINTREIEHRI